MYLSLPIIHAISVQLVFHTPYVQPTYVQPLTLLLRHHCLLCCAYQLMLRSELQRIERGGALAVQAVEVLPASSTCRYVWLL